MFGPFALSLILLFFTTFFFWNYVESYHDPGDIR